MIPDCSQSHRAQKRRVWMSLQIAENMSPKKLLKGKGSLYTTWPSLQFSLTYSDDLHTGILQSVCRGNGIILRFPIGQQDKEKWCVRPRTCLDPHVLLHDMEECLAWEMDAWLHTDRHILHALYCTVSICAYFLTADVRAQTLKHITMNRCSCVFTCKCVSSLISEIPYCLQQLVFSGEVVELPFCAGISTVLGQTWDKKASLQTISWFFLRGGPLKLKPLYSKRLNFLYPCFLALFSVLILCYYSVI